MIIGGSKAQVIENIKKAVKEGDLNGKVETGDPILTPEESDRIVYGYANSRNSASFKLKSMAARQSAKLLSCIINKDTEILGLEKLKSINGGAVITCNHFNPLDNTVIRYLAKKSGRKRVYTVAQETNLAMDGFIGFFMNYADIIPISGNMHYMQKEFYCILSEHISNGDWVVIYPEQEMWFNYKKPRPLKIGAYHYAARLNVPVISCFAELCEQNKPDNEEFSKVTYKLHILDPIYPDKQKNSRENSRLMQEKDTQQRISAYEKIYGKELDYTFEYGDIAGWHPLKKDSEKEEDLCRVR